MESKGGGRKHIGHILIDNIEGKNHQAYRTRLANGCSLDLIGLQLPSDITNGEEPQDLPSKKQLEEYTVVFHSSIWLLQI